MAQRDRFQHPDFGVLERKDDDLWTSAISVEFDGSPWNISLLLQMDVSDGVEENQISAYRHFDKQRSRVFQKAEVELRAYAESKGVRRTQGYRLAEVATPVGVIFPDLRPLPTFGLLFDVTWDPGHGAAIKFEDGKFVEIGSQDIVL